MKYILTEEASNDLIEIGDYIAIDNIKAAEKLIIEFTNTFERLISMPEMGHRRLDLTKKNVRFYKVKSYLVIYQVKDEVIIIVRVLSTYRDIAALLGE